MKKEEVQNFLYLLHRTTFRNKKLIENSSECGCFYCDTIFLPTMIQSWCDNGETAICPYCGMDSVIANSTIDVTDSLLLLMNKQFFGNGIQDIDSEDFGVKV